MVVHQRAGVVEQDLLRDPAEVREGAFDAVEPGRLPLVAKRLHVAASRVAQRRHEQIQPRRFAADHHPRLAEVDLQLAPGRRLEADRRPRLSLQRPPQRRHGALHRPQADDKAVLAHQLLAYHVGIAPVLAETLGEPALKAAQHLGTLRLLVGRPAARSEVSPHGHVAAAKLPRDPPNAPAQSLEPEHRRDLVRLPHLLPPIHNVIGTEPHHILVHQDLLALEEGPVPQGETGPVLRVARQPPVGAVWWL